MNGAIAEAFAKSALGMLVPGCIRAAYAALSSSGQEVKAAESGGLARLEEVNFKRIRLGWSKSLQWHSEFLRPAR